MSSRRCIIYPLFNTSLVKSHSTSGTGGECSTDEGKMKNEIGQEKPAALALAWEHRSFGSDWVPHGNRAYTIHERLGPGGLFH